ncbi:MAG: hypothetical protein JXB10_13615, partial [Pirellulales bacterium]|nr:hypothetical protein [Pirellulales bacterium]
LMSQSLLALPVQVTTAAGAFDAHKNIMKKPIQQLLIFVFLQSNLPMKHLKKEYGKIWTKHTQKVSFPLPELRDGCRCSSSTAKNAPTPPEMIPCHYLKNETSH